MPDEPTNLKDPLVTPAPAAAKLPPSAATMAPTSTAALSSSSYIALPSDPKSPVHVAPSRQQPAPTVPRASWARIYSLCVANFGINCAWALEFAITTPYFEKSLRAGKVVSHTVWIVGPLSGLIVAPIVGALSDRCTSRFGRRRPFILCGVVATVLGMLLFSNAAAVADVLLALGGGAVTSRLRHNVAIAVAVFSFCVLDLAINTTMWPVRALQGDLVPKAQQHHVQSASIVMFSLGDLCASFLINYFDEPVSHIRLLFFIVAVLYAVSGITLLVLGKEASMRRDDPSLHASGPTASNGGTSPSLNIFSYLRALPPWMWRIGITHALGFFSLFCFLPNTSSWLGGTVLGGNPYAKPNSPKARLYEDGVGLYGKASLVRSLIQIVYSAVYPWLLNVVSPAQLMSLSFGVFGVLLMIFANTNARNIGQIVVYSMALPIGAHFTLPVGLTVENSDMSNRGRFLGALNCFAVVPQLIDTAYTGFVSEAFGEAAVMRVGAAWAIITSVFAFFYMRI